MQIIKANLIKGPWDGSTIKTNQPDYLTFPAPDGTREARYRRMWWTKDKYIFIGYVEGKA